MAHRQNKAAVYCVVKNTAAWMEKKSESTMEQAKIMLQTKRPERNGRPK